MTRMCCVCNRVEEGNQWLNRQKRVIGERVTHGYCPDCFIQVMSEIDLFIEQDRRQASCAGRPADFLLTAGGCA